MNAISTEGLFKVFDRTARSVVRNHEGPGGEPYPMSSVKAAEMPEEHALLFLKSPDFKVVAPDGRELTPIPEAALQRGNDEITLEADETVARFAELNDEALLARVVNRPGGHRFRADSPREAMLSFLETAPKVAEIPVTQRVRSTGSEELSRDEQLPQGDIDKLMPKGLGSLEGA